MLGIPSFLHENSPLMPVPDGTGWTIYSNVTFGNNVRLGSNVTIEDHCFIGDETLIGNGVAMRPGTTLGRNCMVGHLTVFEGETHVGDDTLIHAQCHITLGVEIGDKVFIGVCVMGLNDWRMCHRRPHMKWSPEPFKVLDGARVGSGAIIMPGVIIGKNSIVAAGAIVTRDVPDCKMVMGVPAKIVGDVPKDEWL